MNEIIVIGCGYHARGNLIPAILHTDNFSDIIIYDLHSQPFELVKTSLLNEDLSKITFSTDWAFVEQALYENILAVIATPADSHLDYFSKLVQMGVTHIYIEKPLAQSLEDIDKIEKISKKNGVKVACGFYNSFLEPFTNFTDYQTQYKLGPLCSIKAYGGNNDLSAFGTHIIDLANLLFDTTPIKVFGNILGTTENPRGKSFLYHGGSAFFEYQNARELIISYHPESYVSNRVQLLFQYGLINFEYIDQSSLKIFSVQDKTEDRPIYRHQPAELIDKIKLNFDWLRYFSDIFINLINNENYPDLKRNMDATNALLGALISNDMGIPSKLPIEKENKFYGKKYPIT